MLPQKPRGSMNWSPIQNWIVETLKKRKYIFVNVNVKNIYRWRHVESSNRRRRVKDCVFYAKSFLWLFVCPRWPRRPCKLRCWQPVMHSIVNRASRIRCRQANSIHETLFTAVLSMQCQEMSTRYLRSAVRATHTRQISAGGHCGNNTRVRPALIQSTWDQTSDTKPIQGLWRALRSFMEMAECRGALYP